MKPFHHFLFILLASAALAQAAEPFRIYAPSRSTNSLLVVKAEPTKDGLTLTREPNVDLKFAATTIVAHPEKPLLYVSTNNSKDATAPGAVVALDKEGMPNGFSALSLNNGYSYLSLDRANRFLLGNNYGGGQVDVYPLDKSGTPGKRVANLDEGRRNAHCVLPSPDNRFVYIPYVKDTNALYQYSFDAESGTLTPLDPKNANPPEGTGPRHMAYHPTLPYVYFSNEQGLGVSVYEKHLSSGQLALHQVCDAVPAEDRPEKGVSASDIAITSDGKYLFTGLRGNTELPDAISRYRILDNGHVEHLGLTPADAIPWGLTLSPDQKYLLVTAFKGATLTAFEISGDGDLKNSASVEIDPKVSDLVAR